PIPPRPQQDGIVGILSSLDEKIRKNTEVNENLLQQAQALYRELFVNTPNESRKECRAEEYFDIAIGKTPPRKEHQWFTTNPTDVTWVSISDMGSCGTYISKSSEQLTQEAVDKFNIRVIPDNTVLLSFKLTVGRIAITHGEMTTNEAIAHFKTDKPYINEYLYCYLKDFNYQTMGSTSSIATAVNSKIIKAMPFIVPTDDEIVRFHAVAGPIFAQILNNQLENDSLAALRDTLLPKLMSGELDVSELDL
ncbi:MAG: restriction endonuclease subunit S, partial [Eubacteriaceae bacterium]|nr:restriction endonuclease subunit S [Eubacteriaceae bacterium]